MVVTLLHDTGQVETNSKGEDGLALLSIAVEGMDDLMVKLL